MDFQVAGIEVSPWVPPLVSFCISFFTSMGGVSGAFLLLPFQVSVLGYTTPSVSATNQLYNIVAIPSGVYRFVREGRMVWPLTWIVVIGTLPGVFLGAILRVRYLPDPRNFKLFAAFVLLYIGGRMILDLVRKANNARKDSAEDEFQKLVAEFRAARSSPESGEKKKLPGTRVKHMTFSRVVYDFYGQTYNVNVLAVSALSLIVGIVGGVYGIGGGAIIAPFFVTFLGLPVYTVAGASLMGTFVTSVAGVTFYQMIAPVYPQMVVAPDWLLGILFGVGGAAGIYSGARFQKYVPPRTIKWILVVCILIPAAKYLWQFVAG